MPTPKKIAWVTSWNRVCGIADYSKALWPAVEAELGRGGFEGILISQDEFKTRARILARLRELKPGLIHFQHEYGIWGGKNPPFYRFPALVKALRKNFPEAKLTATAHTVLSPAYRFPTAGRGLQKPVRLLANAILLKPLRKVWQKATWAGLDGVIVHSSLQQTIVEKLGVRTEVIPHFVHATQHGVKGTVAREEAPRARTKTVVVFGFFTPEKGQDVAIEALAKLPETVRLVLAGGVRRGRDRSYQDRCLARARELRLMNRLEVTGFVHPHRIDSLFAGADLVLAPFRETTGSGSLAQALARGAAVLASDLPLNREIGERERDALAFFHSGDAADCGRRIQELLEHPDQLARLKAGARRYAETCAPEETARRHLAFFNSVLQR